MTACLLRAASAQQAADEAPERQDRCFCVKFMGGYQNPYSLTKLRPTPAKCRKLWYKPGPVSPFFEGLLTCDELRECRAKEEDRAEKIKLLEEKIELAKKNIYSCCREGSSSSACDPKCAARRKKELKALEAGKKRLENSVNEACIAKSRKK
ncbi:MAG TPA: hypothetical protein DCZ92_14825 [Elusimicrobia bacterium]|nr:MAG: hypothetical protein A2016_10845 [Elusimicrobia bacterium GWF2_62_30]HBA62056.1 hypothetical protein [Elusimicrobiota bacterium]